MRKGIKADSHISFFIPMKLTLAVEPIPEYLLLPTPNINRF